MLSFAALSLCRAQDEDKWAREEDVKRYIKQLILQVNAPGGNSGIAFCELPVENQVAVVLMFCARVIVVSWRKGMLLLCCALTSSHQKRVWRRKFID